MLRAASNFPNVTISTFSLFHIDVNLGNILVIFGFFRLLFGQKQVEDISLDSGYLYLKF